MPEAELRVYTTSDIGLAAWLNMAEDNTYSGQPRLRMLKSERIQGGGRFEFVFLDPVGKGAELAMAYTRTESALHDQHVKNLKALVLNRSSVDGVETRAAGSPGGRGRPGSVGHPAPQRNGRSGP